MTGLDLLARGCFPPQGQPPSKSHEGRWEEVWEGVRLDETRARDSCQEQRE